MTHSHCRLNAVMHLTADSPAQLRAILARLLPEFDIVSFDVFDTLVGRQISPPDQVKRLAAKQALLMLNGHGIDWPIDELLWRRDQAERALRSAAEGQGKDSECAFSAIAGEIARQVEVAFAGRLPDEDVRAIIVEAEVAAELRVLFVKPGMAEILGWLANNDKRVIVASDMYLDGFLLRRILDQLGLGRYIEKVYVSSDHQLGKHSGRLFKQLLKAEQATPSRTIHVGDNVHSDGRMASACGIRSIHLHEVEHVRKQQELQAIHWLGKRNHYWRGAHVDAMIPRVRSDDFFERYGNRVLGPIYSAFVAKTIDLIENERPREVYFLARDGHLFRQIYDVLRAGQYRDLPPSRYLYVSRRAVALPASWNGISVERLLPLVSYHRQQGFSTIANGLGIPAEQFLSVARRFGLADVFTPFVGWTRREIELLVEDPEFQSVVIAHARPARETLRQYLSQEAFFGSGSVALVDIGWSGSIQRALIDAFHCSSDCPEIRGYYLSYNDAFQYSFSSDQVTGVLYDKRRMHPDHNVFVHFEEVFENSARANHGTTEGYQTGANGTAVPRLRAANAADRTLEQTFDSHAESLRRGALNYASSFAAVFVASGYRADELIPFANVTAERLVIYPTHEEVQHLSRIVHTEDAGTDNVLDFAKYRLPGPSAVVRPLRILHSLKTSHWTFGTAKSLGVPGVNRALRLLQLYRIRREARMQHRSMASLIRIARPKWWELALLRAVRLGAMPYLVRLRDVGQKIL